MEKILLVLHSYLRWALLFAAAIAIVKAVMGLINKKDFGKSDNRIGLILTSLADSQLIIGIILYFMSAIVKTGLEDFGGSMKLSEVRFYMLEHPLIMIIAIVLFHIGRAKSKRAATSAEKHKKSLIFYGIGLLLILSRIPWDAERLFR